MLDHTDNTLAAAIKALDEVVAPAIDHANPLATEQLTLVVDALRVLRERVDHLPARHRFELGQHVASARLLAPDAATASEPTRRALDAAITRGAAALQDPDATTGELREAAARVAAVITALVRESDGLDPDVRRRIETAVVTAAETQIEVDRAWHLPQGFDPEPDSVPPLERVLRVPEGARG